MYMRKINTHSFQVATRTTSRDVNRTIALNLIREHQPISRAELSRRMGLRRSPIFRDSSAREIGWCSRIRLRAIRRLTSREVVRVAT